MNRTVEVCMSPELMHLYNVQERIVVVVDVLRATSCMVAGLGSGVASITPFAELEACRAMKHQGYRIAAERNGHKVDGFDMGNSPYEYMATESQGQRIATTTTNGTRAIELSKASQGIYIGAFLNLTALAADLRQRTEDILILCAGWKGRFNLEDTLFGGALIQHLADCATPLDDAALAAHTLYQTQQDNLTAFLMQSAHAQRLSGPSAARDIELCLSLDKFEVVPTLQNGVLKA